MSIIFGAKQRSRERSESVHTLKHSVRHLFHNSHSALTSNRSRSLGRLFPFRLFFSNFYFHWSLVSRCILFRPAPDHEVRLNLRRLLDLNFRLQRLFGRMIIPEANIRKPHDAILWMALGINADGIGLGRLVSQFDSHRILGVRAESVERGRISRHED